MKNAVKTIFLLNVVLTLCLAQSNVSNPVKIKGPNTIAKERYPELFTPKDEFETDAEYQARLKKQKEAIARVEPEFKAIIKARADEAERQRKALAEAAESELHAKITASLRPVTMSIESIGAYSANDEAFQITVNGQPYIVKVPRSEARSFKENYTLAQVGGYKQLKRDLQTWEFFNFEVIHPVSGSHCSFGTQKKISGLAQTGAPVAVSKSVIPPELTMRVAFSESNGNGFLDAGEKGQVKVTITNSGKGSAIGVTVNLKPEAKDAGVTFDATKFIGEIPAGQSRSATLEINTNKSVQRKINQFTISAMETYGFPPDPVQVSFETYPFIPPKIELVDYGITTATGEAVIRPGVNVEVQARVQNRGQGSAEKVNFKINLPDGVYFAPESKTEYQFGTLKPGEYKDLVFSLIPSKRVAKEITVNIGFSEENTSGALPLNLAIEKPLKTVGQLVVKGQELSQTTLPDVATVSVDIEKDIPQTKTLRAQDFAVVFGIEMYKNVPGVTFARRDAQWMKTYIEKVLGIPAGNIYFKTDADVSLAEFRVAFSGWLQKRVQKGVSNVYIYYAGHGAPELKEKKAYLIPYDGNPNYPEQSGYELTKLYEDLNALDAKTVTVFLDACFSGANRDKEMLLADARPIMIEVEGPLTGNVTVFSATSGSQIASAWPEKKHGLFSYFLMKGLQNMADSNGDRVITVRELGDYLQTNVSQTAGLLDREQTSVLQTNDDQRVLVKY
ncbi:MAG: caspase family protein [Candidatus Neomarinimicrobiota bacterium]